MCTALLRKQSRRLFGRTLDVEVEYGEELICVPSDYPIDYGEGRSLNSHMAFMGIGVTVGGTPLFFEAMNEAGLCVAALSFNGAKYFEPRECERGIASFALIPHLMRYASVSEVREELSDVRITSESFAADMPPTPLHWMVSARDGALAVEQTERGLLLYDDFCGALANAPEFPFHAIRTSELSGLSSTNPNNSPGSEFSYPSGGYGALGLPGDFSSPSRFLRAAVISRLTPPSIDEVGTFFHIMDCVAIPCGAVTDEGGAPRKTVYTSCMDADAGKYYFHTYGNRSIRAAELADFKRLTHIPIASPQNIEFIN